VKHLFIRYDEYQPEVEITKKAPELFIPGEERNAMVEKLNNLGAKGIEIILEHPDFYQDDVRAPLVAREGKKTDVFEYKFIPYKSLRKTRRGAILLDDEDEQGKEYLESLDSMYKEMWTPVLFRPYPDGLQVLFCRKMK